MGKSRVDNILGGAAGRLAGGGPRRCRLSGKAKLPFVPTPK